MNLNNHEDFADGFETAELLRHNTSKPRDVQISLKKYIIHMKQNQNEFDYNMDVTLTPECLIDVPLEIAEKNDNHKKLYEQFVEYMRTGPHENLLMRMKRPDRRSTLAARKRVRTTIMTSQARI